ncbi:MAG: hypothetical protein CVT66_09935 [Actinobacteria bacterium HGW-Actinobacteria-6]|jgi:uncharacterized membrane protein|nr:MAG: hypothetical protein CVT66_09935 [Actinobacteria bacterium HGW-Actinobacteria-6]
MMGYEHFGYGIDRMASGHSIGGAIFGLFLLALVAGLIIWLVVGRQHAAHHTATAPQAPIGYSPIASEDRALVIARERLAKGEIDVDQYTVIANALRS